MNNKNTDNNRYGYPYVKNQENDILIIDTAISWAEKEKDNITDATLNLSSLRGIVNHWSYCRLADYCLDDAFALRWRRLISPFIAVTIKPALLSPFILTCSISSMTSCGMRTVVICDFAFLAPVAITESSMIWCISLYIKSKPEKVLTFISPKDKVKYTLKLSRQKTTTPRSATNTIEASNQQPLIEVTTMAGTQHTQTRPKFTCLIASGNQRLIDIHVQRFITVLAGISFLRSVFRQEVRRG
ncbi:hypothetical protein HZS38_05660 [Xenorhabdus nematophila]|nr:hypothetical protein D3790_05775 [Xenorhabdus nematophila]MBA0018674.1 hypothetical protein [Xenorhabdus nematophila]MCB4426729.1 hypothetical protein [Xenorhabdus nematophila]